MKHLFIPYELALKAKEAGFNEPCFGRYDSSEGIKSMPKESIEIYGTENWNSSEFEFEKDNGEGGTYKEFAVSAPLYQQIIDWFRDKGIKIIENEKTITPLQWQVKPIGSYGRWFTTLDKAIEQAFTLITK